MKKTKRVVKVETNERISKNDFENDIDAIIVQLKELKKDALSYIKSQFGSEIAKQSRVFLEDRWDNGTLTVSVERPKTEEEIRKDELRSLKASERARKAAQVRKEKMKKREFNTYLKLKRLFEHDDVRSA